MKRLLFISLLTISCFTEFSQEKTEKKGRPNVPGILQIEYGLSYSATESVPFKVLGSRTLNFYYLQDLRFGQSKFSFNPGIGIGMDRFKFDTDSLERPIKIIHGSDSSNFVWVEGMDVKKSVLNATYLDVPIEFRFKTRPDDPSRSFNVTVGGKVGLLIQGKSKLKYKEDNAIHKLKEVHSFHLNKIRYTTYLRVGGAGFDIFMNYSISPLFKEGEGHLDTQPNIATVGVSFNGF